MMRNRLFFLSLALLLAACRNVPDEHLSEEFGNAVRANVALQTLNPDAGGPDDSASLEGPRAAQAVERMRTRSNQAQTGSLLIDVAN